MTAPAQLLASLSTEPDYLKVRSSSCFVLSKVKLHQLFRPQRCECVSLSGIIAELYLVSTILPALNYGSDLATPEPMLLNVLSQCNDV
jgi:hypothetical protein